MNKEKRSGRSPLEIYEEFKAKKEAHEKSFEAQLEKIIRDAFPSNAEVIAMSRKSNFADQPSESTDMSSGPKLTEYDEISEEDFLGPTEIVRNTEDVIQGKTPKKITFVKQGEESSVSHGNNTHLLRLLPQVETFLYNLGTGKLKKSEYDFGNPNMLYMILDSESHNFKVCYQLDVPNSYILEQLITACVKSFEAMLEDKIKQDSKREMLNLIRPKLLK